MKSRPQRLSLTALFAGITTIMLLAAGCQSIDSSANGTEAGHLPMAARAATRDAAAEAAAVPTDCPVTQPPQPPFEPPAPWPADPENAGRFWYGDDDLWASLPVDGAWPHMSQGDKLLWWSKHFDVSEDETPDVTLTARRLDGDAPDYQVDHATNLYHPDVHWAMLMGVTLPTPGCWQLTGDYRGHTLSYTVWAPE